MKKQEIMLGHILMALVNVPTEMLGTLSDLIKKLVGREGEKTFALLKKMMRGEVEIVKTKILDFIGTGKSSATTEKFVTKEKFRLKKDGGICSWFGYNFDNWFLAGEGKIEDPVDAQELRYGKLIKGSADGQIIEESGGVEKSIITLTEVFDQIAKQSMGEQPDGEKTFLQTDGLITIAHVPQEVTRISINHFTYINVSDKTVEEEVSNPDYLFDTDGKTYVIRAVYVYWRGAGWNVRAHSVERTSDWIVGSCVVSRNS